MTPLLSASVNLSPIPTQLIISPAFGNPRRVYPSNIHTHTQRHTHTHTLGRERMEERKTVERGGSPDAKAVAATESCPRSFRSDSPLLQFKSFSISLLVSQPILSPLPFPSYSVSFIFSPICYNFFCPNARMCKARVIHGSCASMRFVVSVLCIIFPGPWCVSL